MEFVSSADQSEVANSVMAKKPPKGESWSPLDLQGVALLSERMKDLLIKGIEHDVTICVQKKEFRAHRSILSARSPVFAMMFAHDTKENKTSTIDIEDCDPDSFDEFLLYVYSGRTENLTPSNALQLYYPADKYDFPILKEWCVNLMKMSLSVESICDVVLLAAKHQEKKLLEVATAFFARNIKKILVTVGWQNFLLQNPVEANELYIKSMDILLPENRNVFESRTSIPPRRLLSDIQTRAKNVFLRKTGISPEEILKGTHTKTKNVFERETGISPEDLYNLMHAEIDKYLFSE